MKMIPPTYRNSTTKLKLPHDTQIRCGSVASVTRSELRFGPTHHDLDNVRGVSPAAVRGCAGSDLCATMCARSRR